MDTEDEPLDSDVSSDGWSSDQDCHPGPDNELRQLITADAYDQ